MIQVGKVIDGRYEILKEIGRGGMSIVYLAMDNRLNKSIVVKDIRKKENSNNRLLMDSLKKESDLLKNLDHQSLPKIYDIIDYGDDIYVVMDFVEGESLKQKLRREKVISAHEVIEWGKQLSEVLYYLHTRPTPIIYRDMKPDNVMLMPSGKIKLIDFGISREYKKDSTTDTTNLGTRSFAAPEQIAGKQTDAKTDIYSLGVTLYNLVTGKSLNEPPFELRPIRSWDPSLPEGLEYIIQKCTENEPGNRYENCQELNYDLYNVDKLTRGYKIGLIKKLSKFLVSVTLLLIFISLTVVGYSGVRNERLSNYKTLMNKADTCLINEEYTEALTILDNAIMNVDGSKEEAYIKTINIYYSLGNTIEGLNKVEGYISDEFEGVQKNNEVLFKVAMMYLDMNNYPMALKYFQKINEKKLPDAKYYKTLATSLSSMEVDYSKIEKDLIAFEKYNDGLSNGEKKIANYNSLASIYMSHKEKLPNSNDKVIEIMDKATECLYSLNNEELDLLYQYEFEIKLAQTYHSRGVNNINSTEALKDFNEAIKHYEATLVIKIDDEENTLIKIGEIYSQSKNNKKAIEQFDTAIKKYPKSLKAYVKKTNTLLDIEQGKNDDERDYNNAKNSYNITKGISGADKDREFSKLNIRMINLGLL